ncbi:30S ribosomal protein S18 [Terrisporobacter othiniensis]|uniref:[Ribosomal protein bS18]-alanine N-acetyltransferase n=1 Tax=Terrisporobacter othiniensis TaxID=1577792 RepID=A0A0B3VZX6_9FIRM|nr:30S ribosomal protein S18 [Terrisporobacter othiniensis]
MIIRSMTKDDVDSVYIVEENCFTDPWSKESIRKELKNDLARYLVAELDNKIVGYVGVWFVVDEGHITNVAVHSDYRGKKIGDKLVKEMVKLCEESKLVAMTLEVRSSNTVAQNLYRKYGFKMGGIRKEYYSDNKEDAIIMWNQLNEV